MYTLSKLIRSNNAFPIFLLISIDRSSRIKKSYHRDEFQFALLFHLAARISCSHLFWNARFLFAFLFLSFLSRDSLESAEEIETRTIFPQIYARGGREQREHPFYVTVTFYVKSSIIRATMNSPNGIAICIKFRKESSFYRWKRFSSNQSVSAYAGRGQMWSIIGSIRCKCFTVYVYLTMLCHECL